MAGVEISLESDAVGVKIGESGKGGGRGRGWAVRRTRKCRKSRQEEKVVGRENEEKEKEKEDSNATRQVRSWLWETDILTVVVNPQRFVPPMLSSLYFLLSVLLSSLPSPPLPFLFSFFHVSPPALSLTDPSRLIEKWRSETAGQLLSWYSDLSRPPCPH